MGHCFYNENTDQIHVQGESTYGECTFILGKKQRIKANGGAIKIIMRLLQAKGLEKSTSPGRRKNKVAC